MKLCALAVLGVSSREPIRSYKDLNLAYHAIHQVARERLGRPAPKVAPPTSDVEAVAADWLTVADDCWSAVAAAGIPRKG
jgi:hypothetical protein